MLSARKLKPVPSARKKVYTVPITGNYATGTKHRKHSTGPKCNWYQAREKMQPVPSAGKRCPLYQTRENMQLVPNKGKVVHCTKRGKTCNRCQAREKRQLVPSNGKTASYWLINVRDCFDRLTHLKTLRARENILTWSFFAFVRG